MNREYFFVIWFQNFKITFTRKYHKYQLYSKFSLTCQCSNLFLDTYTLENKLKKYCNYQHPYFLAWLSFTNFFLVTSLHLRCLMKSLRKLLLLRTTENERSYLSYIPTSGFCLRWWKNSWITWIENARHLDHGLVEMFTQAKRVISQVNVTP